MIVDPFGLVLDSPIESDSDSAESLCITVSILAGVVEVRTSPGGRLLSSVRNDVCPLCGIETRRRVFATL
jgi:hypothetical protein